MVQLLPQNERQIRHLISGLKTDSERVTVWQNVVESAKNDNVKITAEFVKTKVDEFVAREGFSVRGFGCFCVRRNKVEYLLHGND